MRSNFSIPSISNFESEFQLFEWKRQLFRRSSHLLFHSDSFQYSASCRSENVFLFFLNHEMNQCDTSSSRSFGRSIFRSADHRNGGLSKRAGLESERYRQLLRSKSDFTFIPSSVLFNSVQCSVVECSSICIFVRVVSRRGAPIGDSLDITSTRALFIRIRLDPQKVNSPAKR
jgi:hypothetical protein